MKYDKIGSEEELGFLESMLKNAAVHVQVRGMVSKLCLPWEAIEKLNALYGEPPIGVVSMQFVSDLKKLGVEYLSDKQQALGGDIIQKRVYLNQARELILNEFYQVSSKKTASEENIPSWGCSV